MWPRDRRPRARAWKDPLGVVLSREAAGKRPGGYGLAMCRKIMDAVYYNGKGNMIIKEERFP